MIKGYASQAFYSGALSPGPARPPAPTLAVTTALPALSFDAMPGRETNFGRKSQDDSPRFGNHCASDAISTSLELRT
jgi:hypothetical protein